MRVLLSTYGSRGDAEPMVGLAVRLRELGAQVRVCAPPDGEFAELPARVGVPVGRVADQGIGAAHDGPTPTFESLPAALQTALTLGTRARATAVAGTIRTDGATVAAKRLLDSAGRERPPMSA
ncbi:hypothetical protein [Streptomyces sp. NPDC005969]|uniref:hypothetical protein n=1 Tax=Streptomyces sp. NPDC005969 TaxID=3156722 RepID=UPI0033DC731C